MNIFRGRDLRHIGWAVVVAVALAGCESGVSGHAPGLAGTQTLDPGTFTYPLAYIKRPPLASGTDVDVRDLITSTTGGDVYIRDQASAGGVETNITKPVTGGKGDVRDLDVSVDGTKLIFSVRLPLDPTKANTDVTQPTWKIYQYDTTTKSLTQLTNDTTTSGHDLGAHYLPDGRIVFTSTRQAATQTLLIDEGRPQYPAQTDDRTQPVFLLHVMNADGSGIHQISFNTNHDFAPSVLANGQIVFSRYENVNGDQISLYRTNPDGTGLELYYGANSHATGTSNDGGNANVIQFLNARERTDGKLIAIARPFTGTQQGGDLLQIDAHNYVECDQPATPGGNGGTCAVARPGQSSATTLGVTTDMNKPSLGGRFASAYPLYDGTQRMLVSWAPCLVQSGGATSVCTSSNTSGGNVVQAPPQYTLWVYDIGAGTLSPLLASQSGLTLVDPVILEARTPAPSFVPDTVPSGNAALLANGSNGGLGVLAIRSVYDFDGVDTVSAQTNGTIADIAALADPKQATADQRPARFIRIEKAVEIPDKTVRKINASAFGPAGMGMREILAYAPIEPDGSVQLQVPANVPFTIDILDKNARRIGAKHPSWLQLLPGETKTCNGCHTAGSTVTPSHGRAGLTASANPGAPVAGAPFPNTVSALPAVAAGDTMALTRVNNTCASVTAVTCAEVPSIDVLYSDVWTPALPNTAGRAPDASFSYLYADLTTPQPKNAHCAPWDALCRSTIHYPTHIQPLWNFARQTLAADHVTVLADHTCISCHNPVNGANMVQVPQGQLDLTDAASTADTSVTVSYEELLFAHNQQAVNMGVLGDYTVPAPGPVDPTTGMATTVMVPVSLAPPMTAGSASASVINFLRYFDGTYHDAAVDHTGFLTPAELRLITEWLDIGAQFYNDPFVAPVAN